MPLSTLWTRYRVSIYIYICTYNVDYAVVDMLIQVIVNCYNPKIIAAYCSISDLRAVAMLDRTT